MKKLMLIILVLSVFTIPVSSTTDLYKFSYKISGSAIGRILLIFPYRVYYSSAASLIFSTSQTPGDGYLFSLEETGDSGYMIRTLGFTGRSLGILTASKDKSEGKKLSEKLIKNFYKVAPKYSKYIKRSFWNNFFFKKIKGSIHFNRTFDGINSNLKYNLWLKRASGEKPVRINFNIYRILAEVIKSANYSILPPGKNINDLISAGEMKWEIRNIDFSNMLARSALYAAGIFRKIKPLKQKKPFKAEFSSGISDKHYLSIKGVAEPEVSIWGTFKIKKFLREVKIRITNQKIILDRTLIDVYNNTGKGGRFITTQKLIDS